MQKLLGQMEDWHRRLARETRVPVRQWLPSGIGEFERTEPRRGSDEPARWTIRELLSNKELVVEGRSMNHCVASYAANCQKGNVSIWSMQVTDESGGPYRVMTVAVNNNGRILHLWCEHEHLAFSGRL